MKSSAALGTALAEIAETPDVRARCAAHVALTKPRIVLMVAITAAVGYVMGSRVAAPSSSWT